MDYMSRCATYSTEEFEALYTYTGDDLGAVWSRRKTAFRVWAPTARAVQVNLYLTGDPEANDLLDRISMSPSANGTWLVEWTGNLSGLYYTYRVVLSDCVNETCDPYARSTGVNGQRAMILDMQAASPIGWEEDTPPHPAGSITDAVIYELHIRDLSSDPFSGITHKGKFLGLTEANTTTPGGVPTGLDHIKSLGVTHVHLLPCYDYATVDETQLGRPQYNWGYDPLNFNVPEGSYSTDPFRGEVRVREMKQMVQTLHQNGIGVILDVVYNHVYNKDTFCFNRIVPEYFSRAVDHNFSNGSGCGNDTASERSMVRKYIVDSVLYWAEEYHIDGFRFDLVGLLDVETINQVVAAVHRTRPWVIFYGEGWSMGTGVTKPNVQLATQYNAWQTPQFAYFNDTFRNLLRGNVFDDHARGYLAGEFGQAYLLPACFMGRTGWCPSPTQTINYASCHDNATLFDRLAESAPEMDFLDRVRMNRLSAAICLSAQGAPLFQAGEEMLRSKRWADGTPVHNSYRSPDSVNSLKWRNLEQAEYARTAAYYRGLIAFRRAHPTLRLTTVRQVDEAVCCLPNLPPNLAGFRIQGLPSDPAGFILIYFNPTQQPITVNLPEGTWTVRVDDRRAGVAPLATVQGCVTVPRIGALFLTM